MKTKPQRDLDFTPYNLPEEYLTAIGIVSTATAQTEDILQNAIAGLLKVDIEVGWAVTTHMANPLRDSCLRSLAEIQIDDLDTLDELDLLLDDIKAAFAKRNNIVHNLWCHDINTKEIYTVVTSARTRLEVDITKVDLQSIGEAATSMYTAGINLQNFSWKMSCFQTSHHKTEFGDISLRRLESNEK